MVVIYDLTAPHSFDLIAPMVFTRPRTVSINFVRVATKASRALRTSRSSRTSVLRC
jgi:hypothetical protein